jgi:hypothetical protein
MGSLSYQSVGFCGVLGLVSGFLVLDIGLAIALNF